jgi:hypothetical protein
MDQLRYNYRIRPPRQCQEELSGAAAPVAPPNAPTTALDRPERDAAPLNQSPLAVQIVSFAPLR